MHFFLDLEAIFVADAKALRVLVHNSLSSFCLLRFLQRFPPHSHFLDLFCYFCFTVVSPTAQQRFSIRKRVNVTIVFVIYGF